MSEVREVSTNELLAVCLMEVFLGENVRSKTQGDGWRVSGLHRAEAVTIKYEREPDRTTLQVGNSKIVSWRGDGFSPDIYGHWNKDVLARILGACDAAVRTAARASFARQEPVSDAEMMKGQYRLFVKLRLNNLP